MQMKSTSPVTRGAQASGSSKSTTCTRSFSCSTASGRRTATSTRSQRPSASNCSTRSRPTAPVAPNTKAFIRVRFFVRSVGRSRARHGASRSSAPSAASCTARRDPSEQIYTFSRILPLFSRILPRFSCAHPAVLLLASRRSDPKTGRESPRVEFFLDYNIFLSKEKPYICNENLFYQLRMAKSRRFVAPFVCPAECSPTFHPSL